MKRIGIIFLLLCLLLSAGGCGSDRRTYRKAEKLLEASSYAQAEELYASLGDYEDAAEKTRECKYQLARSCMDAPEPDCAQALRLLCELGAYKDAIALKEALQQEYFFAEHGYRIPGLECVISDARCTDARGEDALGAYHRYTYSWTISKAADEQTRTAQFLRWLAYADGAEGVDTEPYRNGAYFLCVDGERLGVVSSFKNGAAVGVTVTLYDDPLAS